VRQHVQRAARGIFDDAFGVRTIELGLFRGAEVGQAVAFVAVGRQPTV
jgi:hypothetical protein